MFSCMGGPFTSFLRYEPLKNDVTFFDPFSGLKTRFCHFPTPGNYLFVKIKKKMNCFDIQCVIEASSFRLNYNMTLESKETYPRHTKTVQKSLGFMPEVKPLHKPRGDLVLCAHNISRVRFLDYFGPIAGITNPIMKSLLRRIIEVFPW